MQESKSNAFERFHYYIVSSKEVSVQSLTSLAITIKCITLITLILRFQVLPIDRGRFQRKIFTFARRNPDRLVPLHACIPVKQRKRCVRDRALSKD